MNILVMLFCAAGVAIGAVGIVAILFSGTVAQPRLPPWKLTSKPPTIDESRYTEFNQNLWMPYHFARLDIADNELVVVVYGRELSEKEIKIIREAWAATVEKNPSRIVVIGSKDMVYNIARTDEDPH